MPQSLAAAIKDAMADQTNEPGMCLRQTRTWFEIPALHDDATEGWKAAKHKHPGDRTPPKGAPVWWTGGRSNHGHIAIYLGDGLIRSTDAAGRGRIGTVTMNWPEKIWGLTYAGWSADINGVVIPELLEVESMAGVAKYWHAWSGKPSNPQIVPADGKWHRLAVKQTGAPPVSGLEHHLGYTRIDFDWLPIAVPKVTAGMPTAEIIQAAVRAAADSMAKVEIKWVRGDGQPDVPDDPTAYKELHFAYGTKSVPMDGLHWEHGEKGVAGAWWLRVHGGCKQLTISTRYSKTAVIAVS